MLILLAARLDLGRQAVRERCGEGLETVEDVDNAALLGERWYGDLELCDALGRETCHLRLGRITPLEAGEAVGLEQVGDVLGIQLVMKHAAVVMDGDGLVAEPRNGLRDVLGVLTRARDDEVTGLSVAKRISLPLVHEGHCLRRPRVELRVDVGVMD